MHELSIAESIVEIIGQYVKPGELRLVETVHLRIGAQSGVSAEALDFGFEAITDDTPLRDARLVIEEIPYTLRCEDCRADFTGENGLAVCPRCGGLRCTPLSGMEMNIVEIELKEP